MVAEAAAVIGVHDFRRLSKSGGSEHTTRLVRACTIRFFRPPTEETAQAVLDGAYAHAGDRSGGDGDTHARGGDLLTTGAPVQPAGGDAAGAADNNDPVLAVIDVEGEGFLRHMVRTPTSAGCGDVCTRCRSTAEVVACNTAAHFLSCHYVQRCVLGCFSVGAIASLYTARCVMLF